MKPLFPISGEAWLRDLIHASEKITDLENQLDYTLNLLNKATTNYCHAEERARAAEEKLTRTPWWLQLTRDCKVPLSSETEAANAAFDEMFDSPHWMVRLNASKIPCLSDDRVDRIINDPHHLVRCEAACQARLRMDQLLKLTKDENPTVAVVAAQKVAALFKK